MLLSKKQIEDYQNFGVIIIKDVFKEWIEPLRKGFQKVLDNPSIAWKRKCYMKMKVDFLKIIVTGRE